MSYVETARGPVELSGLGRTLMHEHVFVATPEVALTDLNIVVATGLYVLNDILQPFYYSGPGTVLGGPEPLIDLFVSDIEEGIAGTGIKAGVLKCVTDTAGLTPGVERVLRATARAHRLTGVPITTHTDAATRRGLDQQRIFDDEGVDLSRVIIGHCGDTTDLDYIEELIRRGSWVGMDRFGVEVFLPFEERVKVVAELCARGFHGQIMLSHDKSCFNDGLPPAPVAQALPRWGYLHILQDVVPALLARGVTQEQVDTMLIDNPRRFFGNRNPY